MTAVASTVLTLVLFATYLGIGALAHDSHFSLGWVLGSTLLVWAGPAQIILISTLGSGATAVQAAIADGELDAERWRSYQKLNAEIAWQVRKTDAQAAQAEKQRWKKIHKAARVYKNRFPG